MPNWLLLGALALFAGFWAALILHARKSGRVVTSDWARDRIRWTPLWLILALGVCAVGIALHDASLTAVGAVTAAVQLFFVALVLAMRRLLPPR